MVNEVSGDLEGVGDELEADLGVFVGEFGYGVGLLHVGAVPRLAAGYGVEEVDLAVLADFFEDAKLGDFAVYGDGKSGLEASVLGEPVLHSGKDLVKVLDDLAHG